jgi:replicative superfamily II helicase
MAVRQARSNRILRRVWFWEEAVDRSKYPYFEIEASGQRPAWRLTTAEDVARLLAEAEITPIIERLPTEKQRTSRRAELAQQTAASAERILALLGPTRDLDLVAIEIDRQRVCTKRG